MAEKSVAIIGAGPAGLIAARKLLKLTSFTFTIFEKATRVGGLWDRDSFIHPEMVTNLCKYTVAFSDFAWDNVDLGRPAPVYPQAWMVEKYLQEYGKLIPGDCFEFETCVTRAERERGKWKIHSCKHGEVQTRYFDHLIVATGYLSTPKALNCEMDDTLRVNPPVPILHSTSYRKLEQILPLKESSMSGPRTVLVIGGSHSGADISGLIAHQASDGRWSPQGNEAFPGVNVVHVTQNVMFPVPGVVRGPTAEHVSFHPVEFILCDRSTRDPAPLTFGFGPAGFQEKQGLTMFYKEIVEGGTGDFDFEDELPPYAVMTDRYHPFVQVGDITPMLGLVRRLERTKNSDNVTATVTGRDGKDTTIENIAAVINATGFDASGGLDFLSDEVKKDLEFDATNTRLPMVLDASYMAQHSKVPDMAMLGLVPVNWSIIEMQCRAVIAKWTSRPIEECPKQVAALGAHIRGIREAIKDGNRRTEVPHSLFGDLVGIMEQAARDMKMTKINGTFGDFDGFICAARYAGAGEDRAEAIKTIYAVQQLQKEIRDNNYLLAQVVFLGLLGRWKSETRENGAAKVIHEIDAHPRYATAPEYDLEYVVALKKTTGKMSEENMLIARYTQVTDEITFWTVEGAALKTGDLIGSVNFHRDEDGDIKASAGPFGVDEFFDSHLEFRGSRLSGSRDRFRRLQQSTCWMNLTRKSGPGLGYVLCVSLG